MKKLLIVFVGILSVSVSSFAQEQGKGGFSFSAVSAKDKDAGATSNGVYGRAFGKTGEQEGMELCTEGSLGLGRVGGRTTGEVRGMVTCKIRLGGEYIRTPSTERKSVIMGGGPKVGPGYIHAGLRAGRIKDLDGGFSGNESSLFVLTDHEFGRVDLETMLTGGRITKLEQHDEAGKLIGHGGWKKLGQQSGSSSTQSVAITVRATDRLGIYGKLLNESLSYDATSSGEIVSGLPVTARKANGMTVQFGGAIAW